MTTVIECTEGHYDVQEAPYGRDYVWCPGCVEVECDCGARLVLTGSETVCGCGTDHSALVREVLAHQRAPHPWEIDYHEWRNNQGELLLSEETYRLELSRLD
jgi:hypothetical protein